MISLRIIISYFIPQIKKYKWSFLLVFLCYGIGYTAAGVIKPLFYKEIIDAITSAKNAQAAADSVMVFVLLTAGIILLYNIFFRIADYAMVYTQSKIMRELYNYAFEKIQGHSYQFFVSTFQGALVAKVRRFVRSFEVLHDNIIFAFWHIALQLIGIFIVLFLIAPSIAGFFVGWCVLYCVVTLLFVARKRKLDLIEAAADSRVTGGLADAITNALNIKMFSSGGEEIRFFGDVTQKEETARRTAWNFNNLINLSQGLLWLVLEAVGLYVVITLWRDGTVSTGTVVLVQTYFAAVFGVMWNLGKAITNSMKAISDASEMVEIFQTPLEVRDPDNPEECRIEKGEIVFHDISFTYGGGVSVFERFHLTVKAGEKIGLVGYSGVGKTTITKLLLRFVDVQKGIITIDGQDITRLSQDNLRSKIAYVPQDPILFHRTLRENIAYGKPGASEEEIIEVAKKSHAHEFISEFPQGYDTFVGERGVKLSGGERQRVAVARAMLKEAPILILDEATSSLDSISEQYVQDAFAALMEGKTTIVVAHRLSTIRKMDRIIVLQEGDIIEEGTHQELLDKKGMYYNFWAHQSGGFMPQE